MKGAELLLAVNLAKWLIRKFLLLLILMTKEWLFYGWEGMGKKMN